MTSPYRHGTQTATRKTGQGSQHIQRRDDAREVVTLQHEQPVYALERHELDRVLERFVRSDGEDAGPHDVPDEASLVRCSIELGELRLGEHAHDLPIRSDGRGATDLSLGKHLGSSTEWRILGEPEDVRLHDLADGRHDVPSSHGPCRRSDAA